MTVLALNHGLAVTGVPVHANVLGAMPQECLLSCWTEWPTLTCTCTCGD